jgi:hypothetical protein
MSSEDYALIFDPGGPFSIQAPDALLEGPVDQQVRVLNVVDAFETMTQASYRTSGSFANPWKRESPALRVLRVACQTCILPYA